jgi:hypothetical protein
MSRACRHRVRPAAGIAVGTVCTHGIELDRKDIDYVDLVVAGKHRGRFAVGSP